MNRDRLLAEMGITPVWKLRNAPATTAAAVDVQGVTKPEPLVDKGFRAAAPIAAKVAAPVPPVPRAATPAPVTLDPERAERIARMEWPALREAVASCQACNLCKGRTQTVFGVGEERARWLIIGEAPGQEEDRQGEPFVGQAGKLLDGMLAALDMQRNRDVFIANVLKCRPPGNRNPEPFEVAQCAPFLHRQVALVNPALIVLMGRFAAQAILDTDASIASLRGKVHRYRGIPAVVTYHPAYLLRNLTDKAKSWEDLLFARRTATQAMSQATTGETTQAAAGSSPG